MVQTATHTSASTDVSTTPSLPVDTATRTSFQISVAQSKSTARSSLSVSEPIANPDGQSGSFTITVPKDRAQSAIAWSFVTEDKTQRRGSLGNLQPSRCGLVGEMSDKGNFDYVTRTVNNDGSVSCTLTFQKGVTGGTVSVGGEALKFSAKLEKSAPAATTPAPTAVTPAASTPTPPSPGVSSPATPLSAPPTLEADAHTQAALAKTTAELTKVTSALGDANTALAESRTRLEQTTTQLNEMKQALAANQAELNETKQQLKTANERISALEADLAAARAPKAEIEAPVTPPVAEVMAPAPSPSDAPAPAEAAPTPNEAAPPSSETSSRPPTSANPETDDRKVNSSEPPTTTPPVPPVAKSLDPVNSAEPVNVDPSPSDNPATSAARNDAAALGQEEITAKATAIREGLKTEVRNQTTRFQAPDRASQAMRGLSAAERAAVIKQHDQAAKQSNGLDLAATLKQVDALPAKTVLTLIGDDAYSLLERVKKAEPAAGWDVPLVGNVGARPADKSAIPGIIAELEKDENVDFLVNFGHRVSTGKQVPLKNYLKSLLGEESISL